MSQLFKRLALPMAASLTLFLAACGGNSAPTYKSVANMEPREGLVNIQIRQKLEGKYEKNGRSFDFVAYGIAPSGFSWKPAGAVVTQNDSLFAARTYCNATGDGIASGYIKYLSDNEVAAGVYFNCR